MKRITNVLYEGASLIDGGPIVVLGQQGSRNSKIGDMLQTFVLRADMDPLMASRTGADRSICGDCMHRGQPHNGSTGQARNRTCYVTLMQAPLAKFKVYKQGRYEKCPDLTAFGRGRMIRIGAYGDGAAVPQKIWDDLCREAKGWTAYTHQENFHPDKFMTSVESLGQARLAWDRGERTFRVISDPGAVASNEVLCPSPQTTCAECRLCGGTDVKAKSIAIVAHGSRKEQLKKQLSEILDGDHDFGSSRGRSKIDL